ncbi:hypothetical protein MD484_g8023, partial [Candolleomyces efflorescens]
MSSVSFFKNSKHFAVNNSTFSTYVSGTDARQYLYERSATGAMHDSEERYPPPQCHPGTREAVIIRITDWYGYQAGPEKPIMWVHAPAGYGKTAIAGTISKMLEEAEGLDFNPLGATFFFWRTSDERNSPARFIVTIAYQLAMSIPELGPHVDSAVKRNPMILGKALEVQLVKLIVEPFKALGDLADMPNRLIIIDGLDECINSKQESRVEKQYAEDQEKVQIRILELIHTLQSHGLPLSFLILSRPETWIKQHIESKAFEKLVEIVDLFEVGDNVGDVEKFVRAELSRIAAKIGDEEWPGETVSNHFVWRCKGHMLYASTVIRHIDDPYGDPRDLLKTLHDSWLTSDSPLDLAHSIPFSSLHELYRQIMRSCPAGNRSLMIEVLEDVTVVTELFDASFGFRNALTLLDSLCGRGRKGGIRALRGLHAVIHLSLDNSARDDVWLRPFVHSSFPEFLQNPQLSSNLAIDVTRKRWRRLFWKCLEHISTITIETELKEDHRMFALYQFQNLWLKTWGPDGDPEYAGAVQKLLAINLEACFIKLFRLPVKRFFASWTTAYSPFWSSFIDSFSDHDDNGDLHSLVQQAQFHVVSSLKGAFVHVIHLPAPDSECQKLMLGSQLVGYLRWITSAHSKECKSDCVVQALVNLRRGNEEGFRALTQNDESAIIYHLDRIPKDEDSD